MNQKGQVILVLILIMTVALAIGLSIIQKSLVDISTASKVEQSSRAFSAAEAGVEKALKGDKNPQIFDGSEIKEITDSNLIPCVPGTAGCSGAGSRQAALEFYKPAQQLAKEDVIQVWLADPESNLQSSSPNCTDYQCYSQSSIDIFWGGNTATEKAALELTLVYFDTEFKNFKWYFDHQGLSRNNGFTPVPCNGGYKPDGSTNEYRCKKTLSFTPQQAAGLRLMRARLHYNDTSAQPFAIQSTQSCLTGCFIPAQQRTIISTGISGETQRKVEYFENYKMVSTSFDYAIFSVGPIDKN